MSQQVKLAASSEGKEEAQEILHLIGTGLIAAVNHGLLARERACAGHREFLVAEFPPARLIVALSLRVFRASNHNSRLHCTQSPCESTSESIDVRVL